MTESHFIGNVQYSTEAFSIQTDRSLDEGPNVLTMTCHRAKEPFMGFIWGGETAKFVEVPTYDVKEILGFIQVGLDAAGIDSGPTFDTTLAFCDALARAARGERRTILVHLNVETRGAESAEALGEYIDDALTVGLEGHDGPSIDFTVVLSEEIS